MPPLFTKSICLSVFVFCGSITNYSQNNSSLFSNNNFPFDHIEFYNSTHGLNGNEVSWMTQDKKGFLWFITDNALNRFDGYSFRSFAYDPADTNSISTAWYYGLMEDKDGTLWFHDQFKGLHSFDPYRQKFIQHRHQDGINSSPAYKLIHSLEIVDDSVIWVITPLGLDKFDPKTKSYRNYLGYSKPSALPFTTIGSMVVDRKKGADRKSPFLWLVTDKGLSAFNTSTYKLEGHYDFPFPAHPKQRSGNTLLDGIRNETLWIGSDHNGIYGLNVVTKQFIHYEQEKPCHSPVRHINGSNHVNGYYMVLEDHKGNLWTTNDNNEIVYYDRSKNEFYYLLLPVNKVSFLDLPPFIFEDKNQKIWLCTGSGVIAIDTKRRVFHNYQNDPQNSRSLSGNFVYNIYRSKSGTFFTGASTLDTLNKTLGLFSRFEFRSDEKINTEGTWDIYEDSGNNIWLTGNYGLYVFNSATKKSKLLTLYNNKTPVKNSRFTGIVEDNKGRYWVATMGWGLYKIDTATGETQVFTNDKTTNSLNTNQLTTIHKDSKGFLYIGTWQGGLIIFDPDNATYKAYHHDITDPASLSNESVHLFHEDKNGLIWFGTFGGGLSVYNPVTKKFKAFTLKDGLAHNSISAIQEDKNGDLWVSTRGGGISRFTPPEDPFAIDCKIEFRNYDLSDGLPSNQFNMSSSFCDTDGTLYFGTRGAGLVYFHPDSLKENEFAPPVYITDFSLQNKPVSVNEGGVLNLPVEFTKEIKLNYKQNDISFSFAALNYIHPEKNKYAYMLENYNNDWIITDASNRFANYTNLEPGSYIFKVKASNNDGIWNEIPTELKIIIIPPFWQTAWFKVLAVLVIAGSAFLFYKYRMRHILMLQKIRNKIAADLHDDIGSTLNSISVYSEVAKKDPSRREYALSMIGESSRKIIDSMSDIVWTINPQNDSFDKIIFRMRSLTYNLLKAKKIECTFRSDEELSKINLSMEIRKNFYLIFKEALNNLVKYSNASRASVLVTFERRSIIFIIRDNGVGFDSNITNYGNGINNMKRRAAAINAELNIESAPGSGTSIQLNMKA